MSNWRHVKLVVEIEVLEHFGTTAMCIDVVDRLKRSYHEHPDLMKGVRYKGITAKDYRRVRGAEFVGPIQTCPPAKKYMK